MALNKQNLNINFASGLDTKTDPFQVSPGKFLSLQNSVFDKAGRLTKRNGFGLLTALPTNDTTFLTTFNGNLTAIGTSLQAYSKPSNTWVTKGDVQPVKVETLPLVSNNISQIQASSMVSESGLICTAYTDNDPSGLVYKYVIADSTTGQNVVAPTLLPADEDYGTPKVLILGNYFIIIFTALITATYHLQYIAIPISNPSNPSIATDLTTTYDPATTVSFDAVVANNTLYLAWNGSDIGGAIRVKKMTSNFVQSPEGAYAGQSGNIVSIAADTTTSTPILYIMYYLTSGSVGGVIGLDSNLNGIFPPEALIGSESLSNLTGVAANGSLEVYYEIINAYGYDSGIPSDYIKHVSVSQSGVVGSATVVARSVGLASKPFIINDTIYFLAIYYSQYQPTYFLMNEEGTVTAKLAYSNGGSYYVTGLPDVTIFDNVVKIPYLFKDLIQSVNKTQGSAVSAGVYAQLGISLATFTIGDTGISTAEIGSNLNLSGGFLWGYDGFEAVENGFFVWPDDVQNTGANTGGSMTDQQYFYQVTYEWSDNQGNIYRSAPSIPSALTLSSAGTSGSATLHIPTLRLTYKTTNPVKIVIYRWSTSHQTYYQVTSIDQPTLNNMAIDYIDYTDTLADTSIIGNNILYTTGGVLENISAPATDLVTLFNNRLWLVDAEDPNLLWFSKQVIQATPVEMSDLLTQYVAPSTSSEGSTGPITAIAPMDDKLVIFKENAMGYISGIGPDNTGANNGYSDFVLITSVVGCENQNSIIFTPTGLMFQSNKGIWLLGRDLSTQYIGAPVEDFTLTASVLSAVNVPGTNQVRFTLDSGITLMYDYYFGQWGTFTNVPALSSVIYEGLHTYVNSQARVFQETPGNYLDNTAPVLMSFKTSWINLAGVQGYERFYEADLLGQYLSPFRLNVQLSYDYNPSFVQAINVLPSRQGPNYGGDQLWGSNQLWGGTSSVFEARIFPKVQKCESFQLTITEIYDPTVGLMPGAGLTLSGLNLIAGLKKGYRTNSSAKSFG